MNGNRNVPSTCCKVQLLQDACVHYQRENTPKTIRPLPCTQHQQQQSLQQYRTKQGLLSNSNSSVNQLHNPTIDDATNDVSELLSLTHIGSATAAATIATTIVANTVTAVAAASTATTATSTSTSFALGLLTTPGVETLATATTIASPSAASAAPLLLSTNATRSIRPRKLSPTQSQQQHAFTLKTRNKNNVVDTRSSVTSNDEHKYTEFDVSEHTSQSKRCNSRNYSRCSVSSVGKHINNNNNNNNSLRQVNRTTNLLDYNSHHHHHPTHHSTNNNITINNNNSNNINNNNTNKSDININNSHQCSSGSSGTNNNSSGAYNFINNSNIVNCNCISNTQTIPSNAQQKAITNRSTESMLFCISSSQNRISAIIPPIYAPIHSNNDALLQYTSRPNVLSGSASVALLPSKSMYYIL